VGLVAQLLRRSSNTVRVSRSPAGKKDACDQVSAAINSRHAGASIGIAANLNDKESLRNLVEQTRTKLGPVDTLICNAASNPHYGSLSSISDEHFRHIFDNNIVANNWLAQMVAPEMKERRSGSIILISSITGFEGNKFIGAYAASKAAIMQMARKSCCGTRTARHTCKLHCPRPGQDRLRPKHYGMTLILTGICLEPHSFNELGSLKRLPVLRFFWRRQQQAS
jgi:NAD(P)-dependent dehydrogenase (short-subunit alcohol dehydrogenase family)